MILGKKNSRIIFEIFSSVVKIEGEEIKKVDKIRLNWPPMKFKISRKSIDYKINNF